MGRTRKVILLTEALECPMMFRCTHQRILSTNRLVLGILCLLIFLNVAERYPQITCLSILKGLHFRMILGLID